MRKITISDILKLDIFQGYRLTAGENGLSNEINHINIYDNPISETDSNIPLFRGDIFLTFFYYGQNNPAYIMQTVKNLIESGASALVVFDEYMDTLHDDVLRLCDKENFPVIFLDCHRPYSLIISGIMEMKIASEQRKSIEDKLITIAKGKLPKEEITEIIYDLNPHFQKYAVVFFTANPQNAGEKPDIDENQINLLNAINRDQLSLGAQYQNGTLLILTFSESRSANITRSVENTIKTIRRFLPESIIGISNRIPLTDLGHGISQSYLAVGTGSCDNDGLIYYQNLGMSRILLAFLDSPILESFYQETMAPLQNADNEHNACLVETMLTFVENDMDYKKTGKTLFVHENTIRYRINKIKELIPYGKSEIDFYETISIVSKIYKIKQFSA